jgi:hypothetical protein
VSSRAAWYIQNTVTSTSSNTSSSCRHAIHLRWIKALLLQYISSLSTSVPRICSGLFLGLALSPFARPSHSFTCSPAMSVTHSCFHSLSPYRSLHFRLSYRRHLALSFCSLYRPTCSRQLPPTAPGDGLEGRHQAVALLGSSSTSEPGDPETRWYELQALSFLSKEIGAKVSN